MSAMNQISSCMAALWPVVPSFIVKTIIALEWPHSLEAGLCFHCSTLMMLLSSSADLPDKPHFTRTPHHRNDQLPPHSFGPLDPRQSRKSVSPGQAASMHGLQP